MLIPIGWPSKHVAAENAPNIGLTPVVGQQKDDSTRVRGNKSGAIEDLRIFFWQQ